MLRFLSGVAIASIIALALFAASKDTIQSACAPKHEADESVVADVCMSDTDCMLIHGGDGSPAPLARVAQ